MRKLRKVVWLMCWWPWCHTSQTLVLCFIGEWGFSWNYRCSCRRDCSRNCRGVYELDEVIDGSEYEVDERVDGSECDNNIIVLY